MGIGSFFKKAKDMAADNKDKVNEGIEKVADVADDKTGGKFSDQIDQGEETAKDFVENLDDE